MGLVRLIINPASGGGTGRVQGEALYQALRDRGCEAELAITSEQGDARRLAAYGGADCLVAVGGDGTANEVANGLCGQDASFAVLPVGAVNVLARELGYPCDPELLADLIVRAAVRKIDTGLCNGRRFLFGAGAGLDAAIVAEVHKRRAGKKMHIWNYIWPTTRILFQRQLPYIKVLVDGVEICSEAQYVIVGNGRHTSGVFMTTPEAQLDDGLLDICAICNVNVMHAAELLMAVFRRGFTERADVIYKKGVDVSLTVPPGIFAPIQVDGDPAGELPASITIEPGSLRVIASGR